MGENAHISISGKKHLRINLRSFWSHGCSMSTAHELPRILCADEVPHPLIVAEEFPHTRHAHPNDDFENEPIRHQKISGRGRSKVGPCKTSYKVG